MNFPCLFKRRDAIFLVTHPWQININKINEEDLIDWGIQFLDSTKIFLDIGAHMGTYSLLYSPHCKQVHAFEPHTPTYYQLCGGVVASNRNNIVLHNYALSDVAEEHLLSLSSEDGGNATLLPVNSPIRTEMVCCRSLDSFNLENIGFIKIDVEGFELNVLKGGIETLKRSNYPKILLESWNEKEEHFKQRNDLVDFMKNLNYKMNEIRGYSYMLLFIHQ